MFLANADDPRVRERFFRLCRLDPRLRTLYHEIQTVRNMPPTEFFCAHLLWHGSEDHEGLKHRLKRLVGARAGYPEPTPDILGIDAHFNEQSAEFRRFSAADKRALRNEGRLRLPGFPMILTSAWAHDLAYAMLFHQLPECRNCACLQFPVLQESPARPA